MSPIIAVDTGSGGTSGGGGDTSSSVPFQSGDVVRLDFPLPFFLDNDVFITFHKPDYSWNHDGEEERGGRKKIVVLVGANKDSQGVKPPVRKVDPSGDLKAKEYSIGGCPLECPFDLNEDFEEALVIDSIPLVFEGVKIPAKYLPFEINDGKCNIRKVCTQVAPFVEELNLCHGTKAWCNDDLPVFSFVDGAVQDSGLRLCGFRWPRKSLSVHVLGRCRPDAKLLKMESFLKYHEQNVFMVGCPVTSVAHAVYEKLHGEYPSKGKVYMEFVFKEPVNVFDIPPEDCSSKIAIRPLPGDANPSMHALWEEIEDLEKWISVLSQASDGVADCTSFLNASKLDMDEMSENKKAVQELLNQEPVIDLHRPSSLEFSDSLDLVLKRVVEQARADTDFTDRLWATVRKCEDIHDLQECLQLVFVAVSNKMYRPYLLLSNNTTMAKNLRMVMKGEVTSLLQLGRHEVMVKMIIECGLAKLFKDYNFAFAMSHLIDRGEVDNFAPDVTDIQRSLLNLKKLHCTLEVMCLSKERLTMSVNLQEGHVKKMLKYFSDNPLNWERTYHFDVPSNDIRRMMGGLHPIYFKVKMDSLTALKWATTSITVSPEPYLSYKSDNSEIAHNSRMYYVYLFNESGFRDD